MFDATANLAKTLFGAVERLMQAPHLTGNGIVGNDPMADFGQLPSQEMHRADSNTG